MQPYGGRLTTDAIVSLQDLCIENAEAMIEDAKLLYENGRYARALALCILSFEELGKVILLTGALSYSGDQEWAKFWKRFRDHKSKRKIVASIEADMWGLREKERRDELETEAFVERMKLLCLYVDSVDGKLYTPMGSFGPAIRKMASNAIKFAEGRAAMIRKMLGTPTEIRIELGKGLQEILARKDMDRASLQKALVDLTNQLVEKRRLLAAPRQ